MMSGGSKNSHCSYCGAPFAPGQAWPRTCSGCNNISYINPIPVAVCIVPASNGVVLVRRSIHPGKGGLALPGGYINFGESWQQAARREVWEETGISLDPDQIQPFWTASAPDSTLLVFGLALPLPGLPEFHPTEETSELVIATEAITLVFSLHTAALKRYYNQPAH